MYSGRCLRVSLRFKKGAWRRIERHASPPSHLPLPEIYPRRSAAGINHPAGSNLATSCSYLGSRVVSSWLLHKSAIPRRSVPIFFPLSLPRARCRAQVCNLPVLLLLDKAPRITRQKCPHNRLENAKFFPRDTRIMPSIERGISTARAVPARFPCPRERKSATRDSARRASR